MRILKTKQFDKFQGKTDITDAELVQAVREIESGLVDARLGSDVYKKRVAASGRGKKGGARTIVAVKTEHRSIYIVGYLKKEQDNISSTDLKKIRKLADVLMSENNAQIDIRVAKGELLEIAR